MGGSSRFMNTPVTTSQPRNASREAEAGQLCKERTAVFCGLEAGLMVAGS